MPPRIPLFQCLRAPQVQTAASTSRSFSSSSTANASTVAHRKKHRDPYALAQARARKAANLSRQEVLKKERAASLGDPVRGITTNFVQSFDDPAAYVAAQAQKSSENLNFFLSKDEVDEGVQRSRYLTTPPEGNYDQQQVDDFTNPISPEERRARAKARVDEEQSTASEALRRIATLSLGSSKDRLRVNKARCIETFGRHNTDATLPPRLKSENNSAGNQPQKVPRVGADTGSSEVQAAILTAKIRTLSDFLSTRGRMDKVNKRNLRLLVHRRQKHLQYLRRKERGGPRWQHLIETLGLTEGTWKGEISL